MRSFNFKKIVTAAALGFGFLIAGTVDTNAQSSRDIERERQRIERQDQRIAKQNARTERERRRQARQRRDQGGVDTYYNGPDRIYPQGYEQGLIAGQADGRDRKYNRFNVYRNSGSAPNAGDPTAVDYVYRQGYLQGYEDGYNGRVRY